MQVGVLIYFFKTRPGMCVIILHLKGVGSQECALCRSLAQKVWEPPLCSTFKAAELLPDSHGAAQPRYFLLECLLSLALWLSDRVRIRRR